MAISVAGRHSNRGDEYQIAVAVNWVIREPFWLQCRLVVPLFVEYLYYLVLEGKRINTITNNVLYLVSQAEDSVSSGLMSRIIALTL
jgi:hypothetical protein